LWKASSACNGGYVELTVGPQMKEQFTVIKKRWHRGLLCFQADTSPTLLACGGSGISPCISVFD
jgi:hypothetical protein